MTNPAPGQPNGFELVPVEVNGERRSAARFVCCKCRTNYLDLPIQSGARINATALSVRAERKGWDADPVRKGRVICPDCKKPLPNDVASELRKVEGRMATSPTALAIGNTPTPAVPIREPTPDQRAGIRHLLEKHFDEGRGHYVDEWSDQRIAEKLNVPRVVVERLRDAAYGPIRVTSETLAAQKQIIELSVKVEALAEDAFQWAQTFGEDLDRVRKTLNELRVQLGMKQTAA